MITKLRFVFLLYFVLGFKYTFGQAPNISYASPQVYIAGTQITPLVPTTNAPQGYSYANTNISTINSSFNQPIGVAADVAGNIYISDSGNNVIKKIPSGSTTPIVIGTGFNNPAGIAVDVAGNVYVADKGNNAVKKIPFGGGAIVTLGSGFKTPTSVAVDNKGDIYIADSGNSQVKEISVAGGAPFSLIGLPALVDVAVDAAANLFVTANESAYEIPAGTNKIVTISSVVNSYSGIVTDAEGDVFVANNNTNQMDPEQTNSTITEFFPNGQSMTLVSGFIGPQGLSIDGSGNIYVADFGNNAIKKISPVYGFFITPSLPIGLIFDDVTGTISGTPTSISPATNYTVTAYNNGKSSSTTLNIAVNAPPAPIISYNSPQVYTINTAISVLSPVNNGGVVPAQSTLTLSSKFNGIRGIAIGKSGNVYVASVGTNTVYLLPAVGGNPVPLSNNFNGPAGVAVDTTGNVYVTDNANRVVKKIPVGGGTMITLASGFQSPYGIAIDTNGNLYVSDASSNQVEKIPAGGGTPIVLASGFNTPTGVAVDIAGNVYVTDRSNNAVKEIPINGGQVITLATGFNNPNGVAVDMAGNVYVSDDNNNLIKKIPVDGGAITTLGFGIVSPVGIALDANGDVFVADQNTSVQEIVPGGYYINPPLPGGLNFNNSTGTINGTPTVKSAASNYVVTAYNSSGSSSTTLNLQVIENANLSNLNISSGILNPSFDPGTTNYTVSENESVASVNLTPTASEQGATILVNGTAVTSGSPSANIPLAIGQNTATIVVTAEDGVTTKTYTVLIGRGSSDATLGNFTISAGTLKPAFSTGITSYTAAVANTTTSITVTPTAGTSTSAIKVNGVVVSSGVSSGAIPLNIGPNTINMVVTAQDGVTTKTYTLTVTRAGSTNANLASMNPSVTPLSPAFAPGTTSYTLSVPNATSTMTVKPITSDANATIKVNGTALASGTTSAAIPLAEGTATSINVVVTAQDGSTTKTYTITVTRAPSADASLSNITLSNGTLSPVFATATTGYSVTVPNTTPSITLTPTVTDANATIQVNGTTVSSGNPSHAIALTVGVNNISVVVTAQNSSTKKTYTIAVTRIGASNANLTAISPSVTPLSPAFSSATTSYTLNAPGTVPSMTVKPVTGDPNATITVNGTAVTSGTVSQPIALAGGTTTAINIVVTAQDGATTKTYTITVTRAASAIATLSNISLSSGMLSPVFAAATIAYTASVPNTTTSITLTPTTTDANATVTVNGTTTPSGTASGPIALAVGANKITTVVTAQNGTTTKTYTVTVTRVASSNANLASMSPSVTPLSPSFAPATTSYTLSVKNTVTSMTVKPVTSDANATITINGTASPSGTTFGPIALAQGSNTISIVVTAQNGTTTKTYTITVTRAAPGADSYDPGISVTKPTESPTLEDDVILVHQGISPNGDGVNDFLVIDGIQAYPDNKLTIMNRNGQLIYEAKGYDNSSKLFDGHSNKNGQLQLPGTYFYQLDYTVNNVTKHKTGFIVLKY